MTLALGTPQRGQTMAPDEERLAMEVFLSSLDCRGDEKDSLPKAAYKSLHINR